MRSFNQDCGKHVEIDPGQSVQEVRSAIITKKLISNLSNFLQSAIRNTYRLSKRRAFGAIRSAVIELSVVTGFDVAMVTLGDGETPL